jgi:hypothetical protein
MSQEKRPKKLLDQMRETLQTPHDALRTEQAYVDWAKRFVLLHRKRHPTEMSNADIAAFLTHLAIDRKVLGFAERCAGAKTQVTQGGLLGLVQGDATRGRWSRHGGIPPNARRVFLGCWYA